MTRDDRKKKRKRKARLLPGQARWPGYADTCPWLAVPLLFRALVAFPMLHSLDLRVKVLRAVPKLKKKTLSVTR